MRSLFLAITSLVMLSTASLAVSTVNPTVPSTNSPLTSAPVRNNFLATFNDINNILGMYAGPSAPSQPTNLQSWADTSTSPVYVFKYWNANTTTWVPYATLNINTNAYSPFSSPGGFLATAPLTVNVVGGVVTYGMDLGTNFSTSGNDLVLSDIASGQLLSNCTGSTGEPTACSWSSFADWSIGNTNGMIPSRVGGAWSTVSTGVTGHTIPFLDGLNVFTTPQTIYPGASALAAPLTGTLFRANNLDTAPTIFEADSYGAHSAFSCVRTSGTITSKNALALNDLICGLDSYGYDGTDISGLSATVRSYAAENWTNTDHGTYVRIGTTANGSTTPTDRISVEQDGGVTVPPTVIGGSQGAGTINATGLYLNGVSLGTAAIENIGTSGATVPLLSGANTWGAAQEIPGVVVTGSFAATGLVNNSDLVNSATTVNGETCVLGGTCTVVASAGTITVGTTAIASGTPNGLLYNNAGDLGNLSTANNGVLVTNGSGVPSISTTLPNGIVDNTALSSAAAYTLKGNFTGSNASPTDSTIGALANKAAPDSGDYILIQDNSASGEIKHATVASIASAGSVASIDGQTGSFTTSNGITSTANSIQLTTARRTLPTTQVFTSGSGTYTTPANVLWIEIEMIGGGGGGGGSGSTPGSAGNGGNTTFGTALLVANGGAGSVGASGGIGGTASGGYVNLTGSRGGLGSGSVNQWGSIGAPSAFGGGGYAGQPNQSAGGPAPANSGAGGGGGGCGSTINSGGGGGAGGYLKAIINSPSATYNYVVGTGGTAGTAGTGGVAGGAGGSGIIIVTEHYGS